MNKLETDHADLVRSLAKDPYQILEAINAKQMDVNHMALGIAGECGELIDALKKWIIYNKPLDVDNVIEELGDLEFYLQGLRDALKISREETLDANIAKLEKRYPTGGYRDCDAHDRADKNGETT